MSESNDDLLLSQCENSSYYAGELIETPNPHWTKEQQIELLNWHPMSTGRCPNCERSLQQTHPVRVHSSCEHCGWKDDSV
ncbi:hypothetical protein ACQ4M3_25490 [Leptolyngbya sp. AN03gr2]|uniref:hypothetical protein n=1 Tax=unclassified Leptolyngbya TaxID=2650499 RepID=UPI003D310A78